MAESKVKKILKKHFLLDLTGRIKKVNNINDIPKSFFVKENLPEFADALLSKNDTMYLVKLNTISFLIQEKQLGQSEPFIIDSTYNHFWSEREFLDILNIKNVGLGIKQLIKIYHQ